MFGNQRFFGVKRTVAFGMTVVVLLSLAGCPPPTTQVRVPNVVGETQAAAEMTLVTVGLSLGSVTERFSTAVPAGNVISQNPSAGAQIPPGTAVALEISKGPDLRVVPNVVGQTQAVAETALSEVGLVTGAVTERFSATAPAGSVISQTPSAGAQIAPNTPVALEVSKGPDLRTVPDVIGLTREAAETSIAAVGLAPGVVTESFNNTVSAGNVISQTPTPGEQAPPGTAVALEVSKGPDLRTVPHVLGQTQAASEVSINAAGLILGTVTESFSSLVEVNRVISQTPTSGAQVAPGTAVALEVSKGPDLRTVPDVVGLVQAAAEAAIAGAGLVPGVVALSFSAAVPAGSIISQTPAAGAQIPPGTLVALELSKGSGLHAVPDVMGMTVPEATDALPKSGMVVGVMTESFSNLVEAGKVLRQLPVPGTVLPLGSAVDLVVSKGADLRTVPELAGMTESAARESITAVGLAVGTVSEKRDNTIPEGHILGQTPLPGVNAAPSSPVDLIVARNFDAVVMPDLVGMTAPAARTTLANAGLALGTDMEEFSDTVAKGIVIGQSSAQGTTIPANTIVTITLSMGSASGGGNGTSVLHPTLGEVAEICAVSDPALVYAIDRDNQALYKISIPARGIVESYNLPEPKPLTMVYSAPDNTFYIISQDSANVTVWNVTTQSFKTYVCSGPAIAVAVDPIHRRIYVLGPEGAFNILDMDTGALLATHSFEWPFFPTTMTIEAAGQKLFAAREGFTPSYMYRYSVSGDVVTLEQTVTSSCDGRTVQISPDGQHLVYPAGCGNGSGYNIQDYDPLDLTKFSGVWDVGTYPQEARWSPDGRVFLGMNGDPYDNYLYVMSASNYQLHRKLAFPNCGSYGRFTPNADGSFVVGFSYDTYYKNAHAFYFFDNVLPSSVPAQDDPIALGVISEIAGVSDPARVYAIDQDKQALYQIDVAGEKIAKRFDLPFPRPIAMAYSATDNALYIISQFSGDLVVWDVAGETYRTFAFSDGAHGTDVAVDGIHRRIYVQDMEGILYILNADSGAVITAQAALPGLSFALHPESQIIIATTHGLSPSTALRYSVAGDAVSLEQSVRMDFGYDDFIGISPDGQRVVCGYPFRSYSTWDFEDQVGEFPDTSQWGAFSPDGGVFLGAAGNNSLAMLGAVSGQLYRSLDFPNSDEYARFAVTSDSAACVGFSYSRYYDNGRAFHFFHDVRQPAPTAPGTPFAIGKLAEITAVSDPAFVYAIDQDKQALYKIDVYAQGIAERYELPFPQPVAMAYSAPDNALYIVSRFSGRLIIWNVADETCKSCRFSFNVDPLDVEIDSIHRRIYVLGDEGTIFVLDLDNGAFIGAQKPDWTPHLYSLQIDPVRQKMFAVGDASPMPLFRFSVAGDVFTLEQTGGDSSGGIEATLSPDGQHLAYSVSGVSGPSFCDYSAVDLTAQFGVWRVGIYPRVAKWSADGGVLYASNGNSYDKFLYVMSSSGHELLRKLSFPNCGSDARFAPNANGSAVVGFSYDNYYRNGHALYFFYDVQPAP